MKYICDGNVCRMAVSSSDQKEKDFPKPNDRFTIYGASYCGYCKKAKDLLDHFGIKYTYHDIETMDKSKLIEYTNQKTIPMIFSYKHFIGGYDDLYKFICPASTHLHHQN